MLQRSSTHISRSDTLMELGLGALYSREAVASGIDHNTADLIFASIPYGLLPELQKPVYAQVKHDRLLTTSLAGLRCSQHSRLVADFVWCSALLLTPLAVHACRSVSAMPTSTRAWRRWASCTTGATTTPACS